MKVYPETIRKIDNGDALYDLCIGVICGSCFCIILMVIVIIITINKLDNEENSGSN